MGYANRGNKNISDGSAWRWLFGIAGRGMKESSHAMHKKGNNQRRGDVRKKGRSEI